MRDHPQSKLLLESARRTLLEQVVPYLDGDARAAALMVARSLTVASKHVDTAAAEFACVDGGTPLDELVQVAALMNVEPAEACKSYGGTWAAIQKLEHDLGAAIRRGDFDKADSKQEALRSFLMAITRQKLSESNPKVLDHMGQGGLPVSAAVETDKYASYRRQDAAWLSQQMTEVHDIGEDLSYPAFLHRTALRVPNKLAVICGDRELTYAQFFAAIAAHAASLQEEHGVAEGSRVALLLDNSELYQTWYLAILSLGAVAVPLNTKLTAREIAFQIRDSEARHIVSQPRFADVLADIDVRCVAAASVQVSSDAPIPMVLPKVTPGVPAAIYYTSGTTGDPKGVVHTHRSLIAGALQGPGAWEYNDPTAVTLAMTPLFHIANHTWFLPVFSIGGTMVIDTFRTETVLDLIVQRRVTHLFGVPTMLLLMSQRHQETGQDFSHVKTVAFGASAMPPEKLNEMKRMFPNAGLVHGMGQTESCGTIVTLPSALAFEKAGAVGINIDGNDTRVVGTDNRDVDPGVVGELVARGPNMMREYLGRPDASAETLAYGWLHTGDLGYLDEDGFLFLVDRKKDMIIRGGENIYSSEVENVLYMHASVANAAVVGIRNDLLGEEVVAFVVLGAAGSANEEALKEHCARNLASFKVPSKFIFLDAMPQTATGKIQKHQLRAMCLAFSKAEL